MWVLAAGVIGYSVLLMLSARNDMLKLAIFIAAAVVIVLFFRIDPKVWGVAMMGAATLIFFLLPWLDQSPVKSIRYKGVLCKSALAIFVIVFLVLGYLGTLTVTEGRTLLAQVCTLIYFAFFLLMPWYTRMDKCKPEPDRVTG
jgi:ubiquinol-cytochrome c reductase cytochrome b subunit